MSAAESPGTRSVILRSLGLVVLGVSAILASLLVSPMAPDSSDRMGIDAMAFLGHAWLLENGQVAYRDFAAAWGPVAQWLTAIGVALGPEAPLDSVPMVYFVLRAAGAVSLVLWVYLLPLSRPAWAALPILAFAWSLQFASHGSFRIGAALLALRAAAATLGATVKVFWKMAALAGGLFLVAALCSVDVFVYASGALIVGLVVLIARSGADRSGELVRKGAAVMVAIAAALLLAISTAACSASDAEQGLFDPIRRVTDRATTYSQVFGLPARVDPLDLCVWLLLAGIVASAAWRIAQRADEPLRFDIALVGPFALLLLKSAVTRSDEWHIAFGLTGVLTFLSILPSARSHSHLERRLSMLAFAGTLVVWPESTALSTRFELDSAGPMRAWRALTRTTMDTELKPVRLLALAESGRGPLFVFPTQVGLAAAVRRPLLAPVDQIYGAHTVGMQRRVVEELRRAGADLEVIFGLDGSRSWQIDGVQSIARSPVLAEFLLTDFRSQPEAVLDEGFLLLRRRERARILQWRPLPVREERGGNTIVVKLDRAEACSLLRLELALSYPDWAELTWAGGVLATGKLGSRRVLRSRIVALEAGAPFTTLVSPLHGEKFAALFGDRATPAAPAIDRLLLEPEDPGPFGIRPRRIEVSGVDCLDTISR